jgi:hypothetical protein
VFLCGLTFELTPAAEAGGVSLVRDDAPSAADQAYAARRSGSGVERGVRPHSQRWGAGLVWQQSLTHGDREAEKSTFPRIALRDSSLGALSQASKRSKQKRRSFMVIPLRPKMHSSRKADQSA